MRYSLEEEKAPSLESRLDKFSELFATKKYIIEQNRDSKTKIFLKCVATVFTLGLGIPWIWNVKGKELSNKIDLKLDSQKVSKPKGNPSV